MEALAALVMSFGVFVAGLIARFALVLLALAMLLTIPGVVILAGVWVYEALRRTVIGVTCVDGLLWRRDLYYTPGHTWVSRAGATLRVGLDDLAQRVLFDTQTVELPRPGAQVHEGEVATLVTCGNKRAQIVSPVDGVVTAVNEAVSRDPSVIHRDPYARGWLFAVAPVNSRYARLLRGDMARKWFGSEGSRLAQFLEHNLGVAAADGGEFLFPAPSLLSDQQWAALTEAFLGPGKAEVEAASGDGGTLEEEKGGRFPRPLVPLVAVISAVAGGLYVILLPVIGFALLLGFSSLWAWQGLRHGVYRLGGPLLRHRPPAE
jgi:glycine cleavage system H lipoate-binding protein